MKNFIKHLAPYIKKHILFLIIALLGSILASGGTASVTYLIKPIIDGVFIASDPKALRLLPILIILAYSAKSIGAYMQVYFMNYIGLDVVREIRLKILTHILGLDLSFLHKKRGGELISRVTLDIELIKNALSQYIVDIFRDTLTILALIYITVSQSPKLSIVGFIIIPMALFPINFISKKIKKISKKFMEKNGDITAHLNEIFSNMELIKLSNAEREEAEAFDSETKMFFKINMKSILLTNSISPLMEILGSFAIAFVIYLGGLEILKGNITAGGFGAFLVALFMIYTPLKKIFNSYSGMQVAIASNHRIEEILNVNSNIKDGKELAKECNNIELKNVYMYYDDKLALEDININFNKSYITAISGKSGAGKSSIINLINRLYDPSSGDILLDGLSLRQYCMQSLRNSISVVTQQVFIFNDTIAFNVSYGMEMDEQRIINSLKKAHIYDFICTLPDGIYYRLNDFGNNLSGGQKQRIAIARAIYKDAKILIFDEATSALDIKTQEDIKSTIKELKKDKLIILITHSQETKELADRIIYIDEGRIVARE